MANKVWNKDLVRNELDDVLVFLKGFKDKKEKINKHLLKDMTELYNDFDSSLFVDVLTYLFSSVKLLEDAKSNLEKSEQLIVEANKNYLKS